MVGECQCICCAEPPATDAVPPYTWLLMPCVAGPEAGEVALLLYKRAAQQGDHAALLSIGDSYW